MFQILKKYKYLLPLYLWLIYSISTILIFEFGPLDFKVENKFKLYTYLFFAHLFSVLGYLKSHKKYKLLNDVKNKSKFLNKNNLNFICFIVVLGLIISFYRDYTSNVSLSLAIEDTLGASEAGELRGGGWLGYLNALVYVFMLPFLTIGLINFRNLTKFQKYLLIALVFNIIYSSIVGSTRHGLLYLMIIGFFSLLALKFNNQIRISFKKLLLRIFIVTFFFLVYSSYVSINRNITPIENMVEYMSNNDKYELDTNNFLIPKFSGNIELINAGVLQGYFYFTHAYKGLSEALNLPFKGTSLFFGHSDFTIRNLAMVFNDDEMLNYSYHYRLNNEVSYPKTLWITAYAWIASDMTFIGSFFLLYFFGSLLASSWIRTLKAPTLISCSVFGWIIYFFFQTNITFVPADLGAFISFWGSIFIYKFKIKTSN